MMGEVSEVSVSRSFGDFVPACTTRRSVCGKIVIAIQYTPDIHSQPQLAAAPLTVILHAQCHEGLD